MKNHLIAFLAWVLTITTGIAQQTGYETFPDSIVWRVDYNYNFMFQNPCIKNYYLEYYSPGDTTINSSVYRKIFVAVVMDTDTCVASLIYLPTQGYVGALKYDPAVRKAFFVFANTTTDSLLYDYDLQVGDTLKGIISQYYNQYDANLAVLGIDSVLINGQYRTRWNFSQDEYGNPAFIIQGIGTSSGLLEPLYPFELEWTQRFLICVKDSFQTYFLSNHYSAVGCDLIVSIKNTSNLSNCISIFPNPFSNVTTLKTDQELKNSTIFIFNSFGQGVKRINNLKGREIKLHLEDLSGGIYFLQLIQENKTISTCKLIIF